MTTSSEDVLLSVNHVKHKKVDGTLYLMSTRIAWMGEGKEKFGVSIKYEDIKLPRISPEGKPKIQLQIVQHSGDTTSFHFVHPDGPTAQLKDRNDVKELLLQLLPKFKRELSRELRVKNEILSQNPQLYQLYIDLVTCKVISAEEFWSQFAAEELARALGTPLPEKAPPDKSSTSAPVALKSKSSLFSPSPAVKQNVGISAAFLADVKQETDGANGIRYKITTDIIDAVFSTYPAIKKKHKQLVPHKMSDKEFWTLFFQSQYFHRDRDFSIASSSNDIFADCAKQDAERLKQKLMQGIKDPTVDISEFDDDDYIQSKDIDKPPDTASPSTNKSNLAVSANQALIRRFNHHSIMVLEAALGSSSSSKPSSSSTTASRDSSEPKNSASTSGASSSIPNGNHVQMNGALKSAAAPGGAEPSLSKKEKKKKREANNEAKQESPEELQRRLEQEDEERRRIKRRRIQEETHFEDLEPDTEPSLGFLNESMANNNSKKKGVPILKLRNKERYLFGPTTSHDGYGHGCDNPIISALVSNSSYNHRDPNQLLSDLASKHRNRIGTWNPKSSLKSCISSESAIHALGELIPGGKMMKNSIGASGNQSLRDQVPHEIQKELNQLYFSCNELLSHFWGCFPVTTPALSEKLESMRETLERFRITKLMPFQEKLRREKDLSVDLTSHLNAQLQLAQDKFKNWKAKRLTAATKRR